MLVFEGTYPDGEKRRSPSPPGAFRKLGSLGVNMSHKICGTCKIQKQLNEFSKSKAKSDGLCVTCKSCAKERSRRWRLENPEQFKNNIDKWRSENPEKAKLSQLNWRQNNKEKHLNGVNKWKENNKERVREITNIAVAKYRKNNRDKVNESCRTRRRNNLGADCAKVARRNAIKLRAMPAWVDRAGIRAVYGQAASLTKTLGVEHHVDHIVPLNSPIVCGLHCLSNLQILPGHENIAKSNRLWPDMP